MDKAVCEHAVPLTAVRGAVCVELQRVDIQNARETQDTHQGGERYDGYRHHTHSKFSFPAPVSKWYMAMPRSILVYPAMDGPAVASTFPLGRSLNLNFCWLTAVGARTDARIPARNQSGASHPAGSS